MAAAMAGPERPVTPMTRHTFHCTPMSISTEARMAKAMSAPWMPVKTAVWVRKPGPIADVAIRKAAAVSARRREEERGGFIRGDKGF